MGGEDRRKSVAHRKRARINWASVAAAGFGERVITRRVPASWNDPASLQVGNAGMSTDTSRMQLNLWAVLGAPLMLGNDVRIMTRETVRPAAIANASRSTRTSSANKENVSPRPPIHKCG